MHMIEHPAQILNEYLQHKIPINGTSMNDQGVLAVNYKDEATQEQRDFGEAYLAEFNALYSKHAEDFEAIKKPIDDAKEAEITWERPVPRVSAEPVPEE